MIERATDHDIDHERALLGNALRHWQGSHQQIFPYLDPPPPVDEERPEFTPLQLPSSFTLDQRGSYNLTGAAHIELQLRRGDAFDVLSDIRDTIHEYNCVMTEKRAGPGGQNIATRVQTEISEIRSRMEALIPRYMSTFAALTSLGCLTQKEGLHPLDKSQLWGKNVFLPHATGDSSRDNPWFWSVGKPVELSETSWLIEREFRSLGFQSY